MVERWEDPVDEALRGLNDAVPEMDARAFAAGRARLRAATGSPPLVRAGAAEPETVVVELAPQPNRRSPPLRRAAPWLAVAAAVAVVAVGAVALQRGEPDQVGTTGGSPPPGPTTTASAPPSSAPSAPNPRFPTGPDGKPITRPGEPLPPMSDKPLNSAGDLAVAVSDLTLAPGQYLYRRADNTQAAHDHGPSGTMTLELWAPQDPNLEWLERQASTGSIQGASEDGAPMDRRAPGKEFWGEARSPWSPTPENLASLPRDPVALYEKVRADVNEPLPEGVGTTRTSAYDAFDNLIGLFAFHPHVPADLRAAVFRTLGYIPGVVITKDVRMADGRNTVALGYVSSDGSLRTDVLIDPANGRAIGHRNIALKEFQGFTIGQEITTSSATEAVVDKIGQRPTG